MCFDFWLGVCNAPCLTSNLVRCDLVLYVNRHALFLRFPLFVNMILSLIKMLVLNLSYFITALFVCCDFFIFFLTFIFYFFKAVFHFTIIICVLV